MAQYPCDQHGGRYRGPQRTAYPAIVNGSGNMRERRRLCPDCFQILDNWCHSHLSKAEQEPEGNGCCLCGRDESPFAVFVTLYDHGLEREDWYGRLCGLPCLEEAAQALFGAEARF